jgi:hypothetical protein
VPGDPKTLAVRSVGGGSVLAVAKRVFTAEENELFLGQQVPQPASAGHADAAAAAVQAEAEAAVAAPPAKQELELLEELKKKQKRKRDTHTAQQATNAAENPGGG